MRESKGCDEVADDSKCGSFRKERMKQGARYSPRVSLISLIHTPLRGNVERRRYACAQGSHAPVEPFQSGGGSGELSSVFELRRRGLSTAAYTRRARAREIERSVPFRSVPFRSVPFRFVSFRFAVTRTISLAARTEREKSLVFVHTPFVSAPDICPDCNCTGERLFPTRFLPLAGHYASPLPPSLFLSSFLPSF